MAYHEDFKAAVVRDYVQRGYSYAEIGAKHGVSPATARAWVVDSGFTSRRPGPRTGWHRMGKVRNQGAAGHGALGLVQLTGVLLRFTVESFRDVLGDVRRQIDLERAVLEVCKNTKLEDRR